MSEQNPTQSDPAGEPQAQQQAAQQQYSQPNQQTSSQPYQQTSGAQYTQQYAQQYPASAPTNSMAVVTLIAGIAGLTVLPFVASIVAVITGPMAKKQIAQTGEQGEGMATAGTIMGWIGIALGVLALIAIILFFVFIAAASTSYSTS